MKLFRVNEQGQDSSWVLASSSEMASFMCGGHGQLTLTEYPLDTAGWIPAHSSIEMYHFDDAEYIQPIRRDDETA